MYLYMKCDKPETVENPELNIAWSSEEVNWLIYGLIRRGDSDWKTKQISSLKSKLEIRMLCENTNEWFLSLTIH